MRYIYIYESEHLYCYEHLTPEIAKKSVYQQMTDPSSFLVVYTKKWCQRRKPRCYHHHLTWKKERRGRPTWRIIPEEFKGDRLTKPTGPEGGPSRTHPFRRRPLSRPSQGFNIPRRPMIEFNASPSVCFVTAGIGEGWTSRSSVRG